MLLGGFKSATIQAPQVVPRFLYRKRALAPNLPQCQHPFVFRRAVLLMLLLNRRFKYIDL